MNEPNQPEDLEYDNGFRPKEVILKENYKFYPTNIFFRLLTKLVIFSTTLVGFFIKKFVHGYKITGKKNFRKNPKGNFLISNHVMPIDTLFILTSLFPSKIFVTSLQSNLGFPLVSAYFRAGGLVPIPKNRRQMRKFREETVSTIKNGKNILFYAEGALVPYCYHIRDFKPGVFHFAYEANATIIPLVITFHKPKGIYRLYKKKPCPHLNILEPYKITEKSTKKETIGTANKEIHSIMTNFFNENSEYVK